MLEQILDQDSETPADRRVRPALLTLLHNQAALIDKSWADDGRDYDLRNGFDTRVEVIRWYQQAVVRSLGYIAEDWPPMDCLTDSTMLSGLIRRDVDGIQAMDVDRSKRWRMLVESTIVIPAFNRAYRELRKAAGEYIKTPDSTEYDDVDAKDLDPQQQKHVMMRPGFQTLDEQQRLALDKLLDGFDSEEDFLNWTHSLNYPTNGEIDEDYAINILGDDLAKRWLIYETDTRLAYTYRQAKAVETLLPAFVKAVRTVDTGELAKKSSGTPHTVRQRGGRT